MRLCTSTPGGQFPTEEGGGTPNVAVLVMEPFEAVGETALSIFWRSGNWKADHVGEF
jgi:hypothetical protein